MIKKVAKITLTWLPSLMLLFIYVPNAWKKIFDPIPVEKVIQSKTIMVITGGYLIIGCALFIYHKTLTIGTLMLTLYMVFITFIHLVKGKPHEVVILIIIATVFAAYLRKSNAFSSVETVNARKL